MYSAIHKCCNDQPPPPQKNKKKKKTLAQIELIQKNKLTNVTDCLVGSLRTAKPKQILISHVGQLLLQGVHDNVKVQLLPY